MLEAYYSHIPLSQEYFLNRMFLRSGFRGAKRNYRANATRGLARPYGHSEEAKKEAFQVQCGLSSQRKPSQGPKTSGVGPLFLLCQGWTL